MGKQFLNQQEKRENKLGEHMKHGVTRTLQIHFMRIAKCAILPQFAVFQHSPPPQS
jgi:hypothetical protein